MIKDIRPIEPKKKYQRHVLTGLHSYAREMRAYYSFRPKLLVI